MWEAIGCFFFCMRGHILAQLLPQTKFIMLGMFYATSGVRAHHINSFIATLITSSSIVFFHDWLSNELFAGEMKLCIISRMCRPSARHSRALMPFLPSNLMKGKLHYNAAARHLSPEFWFFHYRDIICTSHLMPRVFKRELR